MLPNLEYIILYLALCKFRHETTTTISTTNKQGKLVSHPPAKFVSASAWNKLSILLRTRPLLGGWWGEWRLLFLMSMGWWVEWGSTFWEMKRSKQQPADE